MFRGAAIAVLIILFTPLAFAGDVITVNRKCPKRCHKKIQVVYCH